MYDLDGWVPITCDRREDIIHDHTLGKLGVFSTLTDPEGIYGPRMVYTEWGIADEDRPVLRDYLAYTDDRTPSECTHYLKEKK